MRTDILNRKDEICSWIAENKSKAYMCRELRCKPDTLESYLKKIGILYEGNQGNRGSSSSAYKPAMHYIKTGECISSHKLKLKLIKDGIKQAKCEICSNVEWNGKLIPLELDHIDGNHYNNNLENLQIICPNCHAQTETNSGKNRGKYVGS